ncbi:MAG: nitroreductase family protein [Fibrobacterales bacterium]
MSFIQSMQTRYTTKTYDASKGIDPSQIEALKNILHLSPSSINSQPWKFTFVSDPDTKQKLAEASFFNAPKVLDSHTVIVFNRIDSVPLFEEIINSDLPEGALGYYKNFIQPLPDAEILAWFDKQVYLALGVLLSACAEMNIDTTSMEGIETEKYDAILKNDKYTALMAVAIGTRDANDSNQPHLNPKSRRAIDTIIEVI